MSPSRISPSGTFWFSERIVLDDAVDREVERRDLFLRQLDVNLTAQAALDGDGRDALDALEARRDVHLGHFAQRDAIEVALDADAHDGRGGRVELRDVRRIGFDRQAAAHAIDARADFVGGLVEVRAPREVQPDVARSFRRGGVDLLEAGHGRERLLERTHDELFDFGRADAAVAHAHGDAWDRSRPASGRPAGGTARSRRAAR